MDPVQALSALSSVAVILGIVVAVVQVRILIRQRQEEIVLQLHGSSISFVPWTGT